MTDQNRLLNAIGDANTQHLTATVATVRAWFDGRPNNFEESFESAMDEAQGSAKTDGECYVIIRVKRD